MANWVIKIVPTGFQPDLQGAQVSQPLGVSAGDNVVWNNTTDDPHWPWPVVDGVTVANPLPNPVPEGAYFLCNEIAPGSVSSPTFHVPNGLAKGTTISYCCYLDQSLTGSIVVV